MTTQETTTMLGVSWTTLLRHVDAGTLVRYRCPTPDRGFLYLRSDVQGLLDLLRPEIAKPHEGTVQELGAILGLEFRDATLARRFGQGEGITHRLISGPRRDGLFTLFFDLGAAREAVDRAENIYAQRSAHWSPRFRRAIESAADAAGAPRHWLLKKTRQPNVTDARMLAYFILCHHCHLGFTFVGRALGVNHTTVMSGVQACADWTGWKAEMRDGALRDFLAPAILKTA